MNGELEFVIIRHGVTPGNELKRYVGVLDQPLSDAGRAQARARAPYIASVLPGVSRVYVSVLQRTHETAAILFPDAEQIVVEGIQEMNFGVFAGTVIDSPKLVIALYLVIFYVVTGILSIARGVESKLFGSPWILSIAHGLAPLAWGL